MAWDQQLDSLFHTHLFSAAQNRGRSSGIGQRHPSDQWQQFDEQHLEEPTPARFAAMVAAYPDQVAIKTPEGQWRYRDLEQIANQIANVLLQQSGTAAEPIALLFDNGADGIAAILGVLKAGKFYVALDPTFPVARLAYMLADTRPRLLLTMDKWRTLAHKIVSADCQILYLEEIQTAVTHAPAVTLTPDAIAYIVYTSGSTGEPKGIIHTHRSLLHNIMNYTNALQIGPQDRLTMLHSCSFSSSLIDIFCALLNGAAVYPWDIRQAGMAQLADWLMQEKITVFNWAPTPFRHFVELLTPERALPHLRLILLGSEPVTRRDVELYRKHFSPNAYLVNRLGATEANNYRLFFVDHYTPLRGALVPAGYPVAGKTVLLLDEAGVEVGTNQIGEIAVQSAYLAQGYWGKPDLTDVHFLPDPADGLKRIYRTGDLGRLLPDGCLEYLGRKDRQVKIRGYRIEVAEIEQALLKLEAVREAIVVTQTDAAGNPQLIAYIVPNGAVAPGVGLMQRHLQHLLPHYMIPAVFVQITGVPLTPTGKIDYQALCKEPLKNTQIIEPFHHQYTAPRTAPERQLAAIWKKLLAVSQIGIYDDFFELGGHSLLAAQLFVEIEKQFGKSLPLSTLFQASTIAELGKRLQAEESATTWSSLVAIQPAGAKPPFFFVHAHEGNVVGFYPLARHLGPDQPFYGLQAKPQPVEATHLQSFEEMASGYLTEIRTIQPSGPYFLGGWCYGGNLALEMAQQLRAQGEEVALLAMVQNSHPSYPCYQPAVSPTRRRFYRLCERVMLEIDNYREVSAENQQTYIQQRFRRALATLQVKIEKIAAVSAAQVGKTISHSQAYQRELLSQRNNQAYRAYTIRPYPGHAVLFRAQQQPIAIVPDPTLGWQPWIEGGLEVYEIPGHRLGMLSEPRVRILAECLKVCLEQAQNKS